MKRGRERFTAALGCLEEKGVIVWGFQRGSLEIIMGVNWPEEASSGTGVTLRSFSFLEEIDMLLDTHVQPS